MGIPHVHTEQRIVCNLCICTRALNWTFKRQNRNYGTILGQPCKQLKHICDFALKRICWHMKEDVYQKTILHVITCTITSENRQGVTKNEPLRFVMKILHGCSGNWIFNLRTRAILTERPVIIPRNSHLWNIHNYRNMYAICSHATLTHACAIFHSNITFHRSDSFMQAFFHR